MDKTHLNNLTILNTRPSDQSGALTALIMQEGGRSIELPCVEIEAVKNKKNMQQSLQAAAGYDYVIFVSANAVYQAMPYWSTGVGAIIIAIGSGTAAALRQSSIQVDLMPEHFSSQGLLDLADLQQVADKRILILCGENPNPSLSEILLKRKAQVDSIFCYRRIRPAITHAQFDALNRASIDIVVTTSLDILVNLNCFICEFSKAWLYSKLLLVVSQKMIDYAKSIPWEASIIESEASNQAIINKLLQVITWQQG